MKNKLPIYKYLYISTAHIKESTDKFLQQQAENEYGELIVYKKECGYFICVPYDLELIFDIIPNDLFMCLDLAAKNRCYWLVLDADAEIIDELEIYEW